MSAAPNLSSLPDLLAQLDHTGHSPEELFQQMLPELVKAVPGGQYARLYRLSGEDTLLLAATDAAPAHLTLDGLYAGAIQRGAPLQEYGVWAAPLTERGKTVGLLVIGSDEEGLEDWLGLLARHLSLALGSLHLRDLMAREAAAANDLANCSTFRDMAGALARHLARPGQFITLNLAEYEGSQLVGLRVVASANRRQAFDVPNALPLTFDSLGVTLGRMLETVSPAVVNHVADDATLSVEFREWLLLANIQSMCVVPIRRGSQIFGVFSLNSTGDPLILSEQELGVYQNLANQIGALVEVHHLAEASARSLDISERQAKAFSELNAGQDFAQMAEVIARHMLPAPGRFLSVNRLIYDNQNQITGWKALASANRERSYNWDLETVSNWSALPEAFRNATLNNEPYILNESSAISTETLGYELYALCVSSGVKSFLSLPMFVNDQPIGSLSILSRTNEPFTRDEINAFRNLSDQISTLIYTRSLLDEARDSRDVANNLVLASRMITTAENYDDMVQAVMHTVAHRMTAVSLVLFNRSDEGIPETRSIVALGSPEGSVQIGASQPVSLSLNAEAVEKLSAGLPVINIDVGEFYGSFPSAVTHYVADAGIVWAASFGLRSGGQLLGHIDVLHNGSYSLTPEEVDAYTTLADQIGITLENRQLLQQTAENLNFVQSQFEATGTIYGSKDLAEILESIYYFAASNFAHAHLGLIEGETRVVRIVANIENGQVSRINRMASYDDYPAMETLSALETLYLPDVSRDYFLDMSERERLLRRGIQAMVIVPLVSHDRMSGLIVFTHPKPQTMPQNYLRALRSLGDQVAIVFENQMLLNSMSQNLEETSILYEVNRSILSAQDTLDVLRALRKYLAQDAITISHLRMAYDEDGALQDAIMDYVSTMDEEQVVEVSLKASTNPANIGSLARYWEQFRNQSVLMDDVSGANSTYPLAEFARRHGVQSYITMPIRERDRVVEAITISFAYSRVFDQRQIRLYESLSDQIAVVLQSHRLLREAQVGASKLSKQVHILEAIANLATIIGTTQDERTLLDAGSRALVAATGADHCGIVIVASNEDMGTVASEFPQHGMVGVKIDMKNNLLYQDIRDTRQPIAVNDLYAEPRLIDETRDMFVKLGIHAFMFLPIFVHDRIFGSAGLDIYAPNRPITPEMVEVAQTITAQIAIGLQNIRLLTDAQRRAEQLQHITSFSQSVQATLDLGTIFNIAMTESAQTITLDVMTIALYDPVSSVLRVVARRDNGASSIRLEGGEILSVEGYVADVWANWELLHIPDSSTLVGYAEGDTRSRLFVPILSRGRILGLVIAEAYRSYAYSETDVAVFQQMMNQLAIAIENAEAYNQSLKVAKNEALVNDISTRLQRQIDLQSMMDVAVNELGRALGARRARIRLNIPDETSSGD
jgi:GAF domain-containing protein